MPPTVLRDGPFGPGMVQLWMDGDESVDLAAFVRRDDPALRRMAVFDAVVNNADRKGGHIIPTPDGHVYGVDHGICFSVDPKLRTLLWRWAGKPLPDDAVAVLERLADELRGELGEQLHEHLTRREVRCTQQRVAEMLRTGRHPEPSGEWPALPWPPVLSGPARSAHSWPSAPDGHHVADLAVGGVEPGCAACRTAAACPSCCWTCRRSTTSPGMDFWSGATGRPVEPDATDDDWSSLGSFADGWHVEVQRTGEGTPPRWHVDIETDDIPAEVARLEALGATRHRDMGGRSGSCSTRPAWSSASSASRPARSSTATP